MREYESDHSDCSLNAAREVGTLSVTEDLIGDEARSVIGRETGRSTVVVSKREFQRWATAVGESNPLYFDADYALAQGYSDVVAPPLFVQALMSQAYTPLDSLRPDGVPGGNGDSMVSIPKCPRLMAGGDRFTFGRPLQDGDVVTIVGSIENIEQKTGRKGDFVVITNVVSFQLPDDTEAARCVSTILALP